MGEDGTRGGKGGEEGEGEREGRRKKAKECEIPTGCWWKWTSPCVAGSRTVGPS